MWRPALNHKKSKVTKTIPFLYHALFPPNNSPLRQNHDGHGLGDAEVGEPIGEGGDGHALPTQALGEDLGGHDPGERAPLGGGNERNER